MVLIFLFQEVSHDTRRFRFALPSVDHILGLPVGTFCLSLLRNQVLLIILSEVWGDCFATFWTVEFLVLSHGLSWYLELCKTILLLWVIRGIWNLLCLQRRCIQLGSVKTVETNTGLYLCFFQSQLSSVCYSHGAWSLWSLLIAQGSTFSCFSSNTCSLPEDVLT